MQFNTFDDLVREYNQIKFRIKRTVLREQELRALEGFPKSGGLDGMPRAKSNSSSVENTIVKLTGILNERARLESSLESLRNQILAVIDLVSDLKAREVIEIKTFFPNCGWKIVSQKTLLGERRVNQLYNNGIAEINQKLTEK